MRFHLMHVRSAFCAILGPIVGACSDEGAAPRGAAGGTGAPPCESLEDPCDRHTCVWREIVSSPALRACDVDADCTAVRGPPAECSCYPGSSGQHSCMVAVNFEAYQSSDAWGLDWSASCPGAGISCVCTASATTCVARVCEVAFECRAVTVDGGAP